MMFGVGTARARLHVDAFVNLIGEDENSWGLSHKGLLWHNGRWRNFTRPFPENVPCRLGLYFDGVAGTLTFYKDDQLLGVGFRGLDKIKDALYPMVASTAAKTEMTLSVLKREHTSLQDWCRTAILKETRRSGLDGTNGIRRLEIPTRLKTYLLDSLVPPL